MNRKRNKMISEYPVRTCYSLHECYVCRKNITIGDRYFDGGYRFRAHVQCCSWKKLPKNKK